MDDAVYTSAELFWYFAAAAAVQYDWHHPAWRWLAWFNGFVVLITMAGAVGLTLYSLWLYLRRYGYVLTGARAGGRM